jgi:hypothetical protein
VAESSSVALISVPSLVTVMASVRMLEVDLASSPAASLKRLVITQTKLSVTLLLLAKRIKLAPTRSSSLVNARLKSRR